MNSLLLLAGLVALCIIIRNNIVYFRTNPEKDNGYQEDFLAEEVHEFEEVLKNLINNFEERVENKVVNYIMVHRDYKNYKVDSVTIRKV